MTRRGICSCDVFVCSARLDRDICEREREVRCGSREAMLHAVKFIATNSIAIFKKVHHCFQ